MVDSKTAAEERLYTAEEYFELEKHSEERHEFYYGKLELMPGESIDANQIGNNCQIFFENLLGEKGYHILRLSIKLRVIEGKLYRYPDVMIVPTASIKQTHEVKDAELVIEVTSDDSYTRDHKTKLKEYTENFPTLRYYLIIDQYEPLVAVYSRKKTGEKWEYETFSDMADEIPLDFFKTKLPLRTIYKKIVFGEPQAD
ncbi:MAG TPA: Uma2 family endonuclease [Saprospiraceae bacterium]|nr:Uma2 family endonuclease [Saprospiraceae bacterium]